MSFEKDFPRLVQFFGAYFPDADFEDLTDEEIVSEYVSKHKKYDNYQKIIQLIKDIEKLINNIDYYWEEVGDEANRYFENSQDALKWLNMIKKELEK
ncbi:hypothetical protein OK18_14300 [Chryseobacterium gallinarum]|uniref:CdiI immunity protein domain-containing protein n=1 Tax=Chryseobacterium gallinarum TaxID=1324352 RepID=A0A0G3M450_CHRGL|nr:contact-dependent growth inhibition system immunity protein [Chryseobacterium gallinarum]AKK73614.1 hypothetical protein OK18_14300 [Chryseobacterium gallinarum]